MAKNEKSGVMCENPNCVHVIPPNQMSEPCSRFFHHHEELWGFINFITHLAVHMDDKVKLAAKFLYDFSSDEKEKTRIKKRVEQGAGAQKNLHNYRQLILETMVCRSVDNYLSYIAELLAVVFRTRPETLKSNEMVKLEEVLHYSTMEDLIDALAEKRIEKLSYQGMRELYSYLLEKLGFRLFESDDDFQRAVRIIEVRNIIVHNRGIVNRVFKSRVPEYPAEVGERIKLTVDDIDIFDDVAFFAKSVREVDQRASEKFGLPLPINLDKFQHDMKDKVLD